MKRIVSFALIAVAGCGVFGSSDSESSGPSTSPGLPPDAPAPLEGSPVDDQLTEQFGVFVTPTGSDAGDGTRGAPFATIGKGIEAAKPSFKRVYVCTGTYAEAIQLASGISVVGGYDCSNPSIWKSGAARSHVAAPMSPALQARNIDKTTRFEGFEVVAPDGKAAAPSSVAMIAENAGALVVAGATFTAGKGFDGSSGTTPAPLSLGLAANGSTGVAQKGPYTPGPIESANGPSYPSGGAGGTSACGSEGGGAGGKGGVWIYNKLQAIPGGGGATGYYPQIYGSYAPMTPEVKSGAAGGNGADGASALAIGSLGRDGYTPADGIAGSDGTAGSGGSGATPGGGPINLPGTQNDLWKAATGAGGGAGGCKGLAGTPGKGGGASIGAIVIASAGLKWDGCTLQAGNGGAGGKGSVGTPPTAGGGAGGAQTGAGNASPGGSGGRAGVSGSGAGGPSFALAHSGGAPTLTGSTTKAGTPGAGVPEESLVTVSGTSVLVASPAGLAEDVHSF